jgi:transcriptional regulator with XRE-family HTH domain
MHNAHCESFGREAKAQITLLGIKQNQLAADIGISVTRLNRILNGWLKATTNELETIKEYLDAYQSKR